MNKIRDGVSISSRLKNVSASLTLAITAKAKKMKKEGLDVIGFGSGEPDFDTPSVIKDAAIQAIKDGRTKYTPASGTNELKEAICDKFRRENNLTYDPSQIVVSCGAKHSLYNIIQAIIDTGDEIIVPSPYWLSYPEMVKLAGGNPIFAETDDSSGFKIKPDALLDHITPRTKAVILNSPSNPTGCVYTSDELKQIGAVCEKKDILIISDEIYEHILFDEKKHASIAALGEDFFKRTIVVNGVSKAFAMTGWRVGYTASPIKEITEAVKNLQSHSTSNPASISQAAALIAVSGSSSSSGVMVREFEKRRNYMVERIDSMKALSCVKPEGAFYLFCKIEKEGLTSMELAEKLLEEAKVALVPGKAFGSDRHVRLSFATGMENITKGLDRIEKWFSERS